MKTREDVKKELINQVIGAVSVSDRDMSGDDSPSTKMTSKCRC